MKININNKTKKRNYPLISGIYWNIEMVKLLMEYADEHHIIIESCEK